ncbi:hypothetical protein CALCODRAFT_502044 [Calocera cornea HHB12733]|uniref:Uncharacterized protein n=1 Tax=Calocera cornea HHB12733 TaxID=1353952 RepID=A0A165DEA9_9BASI|nr:hypothetical protein CALCODRAFT_502044 [Calocera cornea HHB12733]
MRLRRAHTVAASRSEDGRVGAETMPAREAAASEVSHRAELDKKLKARLRRFRGSHAREEAKVAALALRLRTIQEQMGLEPATERVSIVSELAAARAENAALKVKVRVLKMELGARATASREHHSASQTGSQVPTDSQTDETQRLLQQLMAQRDTEAMAASAVSTVPANYQPIQLRFSQHELYLLVPVAGHAEPVVVNIFALGLHGFSVERAAAFCGLLRRTSSRRQNGQKSLMPLPLC